MDLSYLNKYFLEENSKINILANRVIDDTIKNINLKELKYLNYFNIEDPTKIVVEYFFLLLLSMKNIEIFFDTKYLLNGNILNNDFNNLLSEDSIILLFLKLKIYCATEFNKLIPKKNIIQNILTDKVNKYQNIFENIDTDLLIKNLPENDRYRFLLLEIKKIKITFISIQLILSYYFFKLDDNGIDKFKNFIENVEKIKDSFIENNLNTSLEEFWNQLITNI